MSAINKFCFISIVLLTTVLSVGCSMHGMDSYDIKRSWVDHQNLYVLYEKEYSFVSASLLNIHGGTILFHKMNLYLKKFNKNEVLRNSFDLETGGELITPDEGSVNLNYYVDQDLLVQERHGITEISSGIHKARFKCDHNSWGDAVPIKFDSDVFYCGHIFSKLSGNLKKFSPEVEARIQTLRAKKSQMWGTPSLMYVSEGRYLLIKSDFVSSPLMLKVSIDNPDNVVSIKPFYLNDEKFSSRNKYKTHSTSSFVFELSFDNKQKQDEIYLCNSEKCEVINHRSYSFLIVDDTSDAILFFDRNNVVTPKITIEVVPHKHQLKSN